jgi:hypothetical protein
LPSLASVPDGHCITIISNAAGTKVTFPARQYSVNGERRSFALLRPISDTAGQDRVRDLVLEAYAAHEAENPAA